MPDIKEYKRTLDDEIDWKVIDQLHNATSNFSAASLELKKLLLILVGIAVPSLIKLAGDKLDISLFVTLYILITAFWFLDSFTYFYQEKLREKMDKYFNKIKIRHKEDTLIVTNQQKDDFTIESKRDDKNRLYRSAFNCSHVLYWVLLAVNSFGILLHITGEI
jgi:hypothetical protein